MALNKNIKHTKVQLNQHANIKNPNHSSYLGSRLGSKPTNVGGKSSGKK